MGSSVRRLGVISGRDDRIILEFSDPQKHCRPEPVPTGSCVHLKSDEDGSVSGAVFVSVLASTACVCVCLVQYCLVEHKVACVEMCRERM